MRLEDFVLALADHKPVVVLDCMSYLSWGFVEVQKSWVRKTRICTLVLHGRSDSVFVEVADLEVRLQLFLVRSLEREPTPAMVPGEALLEPLLDDSFGVLTEVRRDEHSELELHFHCLYSRLEVRVVR